MCAFKRLEGGCHEKARGAELLEDFAEPQL